MANEPWQRVIADWHGGMKAGIEEGNLALQRVDLDSLMPAIELVLVAVSVGLLYSLRRGASRRISIGIPRAHGVS